MSLQGERELIQRALIRLQVPKGSFLLDQNLGSELYRLRKGTDERNTRIATGYVQEALAGLAEVSVHGVQLLDMGRDGMLVAVAIQVRESAYQLEVAV